MKHPARHAAVETPLPYVELDRAMFGPFAVEYVIVINIGVPALTA